MNGSVSTKRILDLYKNPVTFLKPDEYKLEEPLQEIGKSDPSIVQKAKDWYQIMKERQYSSIPKVQGNIDDYEYESLDNELDISEIKTYTDDSYDDELDDEENL